MVQRVLGSNSEPGRPRFESSSFLGLAVCPWTSHETPEPQSPDQ